MKAVMDGQCKIKEAAREYGVPRTTLQDRISRRVVHGINQELRVRLKKVS